MTAVTTTVFVDGHARIRSVFGQVFDLRAALFDFDPPLEDGLMFAIDSKLERITDVSADREDALIDDPIVDVEPLSAAVHEAGPFEHRKVFGHVGLGSSDILEDGGNTAFAIDGGCGEF